MMLREFLQWYSSAPIGARAEAISSLARSYLYSDLDDETRGGMDAAMTLALDDSAHAVRFALADALASNPRAPRHVLIALAADHSDIASLVLQRSPIFVDAELVDVAAGGSEALQIAIASRPSLSMSVAAAIAEVGDQNACRRLLANPGARIARISLRRIAERLGEDADLRDMMLDRPDLPASIRQLLIRRLGDALGGLITERSWVDAERAEEVTRDACDRATVSLAAETEKDELPALVEHLRVTGQLTTALLLRTVCAGNVGFFEAALATLSHVPPGRVASLVRTGREAALRSVYVKAGLPQIAFDGFMAAIETWNRRTADGAPSDRYRFTREMVDAVLARYEQITDGEMNELTTMLRRFAVDQAREAARTYARSTVVAA